MPLRPSPGVALADRGGAPAVLTERLPPGLYRRFRRYSLAREESETRHVMHHEVLGAALAALLAAHA